jgi:hypothetical protein
MIAITRRGLFRSRALCSVMCLSTPIYAANIVQAV